MDDTFHIAITRKVRRDKVPEFERRLAEFASRSLTLPGSRGVLVLYPPPESGSTEYGILRSFADQRSYEAFFASTLYQAWAAEVEHLSEEAPIVKQISGLEAWFRQPGHASPPVWKMALLTWLAVWPVSIVVPAFLASLYPAGVPLWVQGGLGSAGIVVTLTWLVMPVMVRIFRVWLWPQLQTPS